MTLLVYPHTKPVVDKPAIQDANKESFSDRTNIKNSGATAYEHGTVHVSCDRKEGHHAFEAVMLLAYKLKAIFARWWP
jgi:hypothetical protein